MEEERKETIKPEEATATAEQLKQYYNGEQWKDIMEKVIKIGEAITEAVKPAIETVVNVANEVYKGIIKVFTADPEIKKCYGIYKRTRKRKDKKKANDKNK